MKYRIILEMKKGTTYSVIAQKPPVTDNNGILTVFKGNETWHIREWVAVVDIKEKGD